MQTQEEILAAMSRLGTMAKGKVTVLGRSRSGRVYYSLQRRRDGRNDTRYVPAERVAEVRQAVENYKAFMDLVEKYVRLSEQGLKL